eukprot:gene21203-8003_t
MLESLELRKNSLQDPTQFRAVSKELKTIWACCLDAPWERKYAFEYLNDNPYPADMEECYEEMHKSRLSIPESERHPRDKTAPEPITPKTFGNGGGWGYGRGRPSRGGRGTRGRF